MHHLAYNFQDILEREKKKAEGKKFEMASITEASNILCCFLSLVNVVFEIITVTIKPNTDYVLATSQCTFSLLTQLIGHHNFPLKQSSASTLQIMKLSPRKSKIPKI